MAEYLDVSAPIENMRIKLKDAIEVEYNNALAAHAAVGDWMTQLKKLTDARRAAVDSLLSAARPGLSLGKVDEVVQTAKETLKQRMESI